MPAECRNELASAMTSANRDANVRAVAFTSAEA
jgi:enoyl-CoA hydratase/carnithine racemase